jgi:AcrR family transcriptional regulator
MARSEARAAVDPAHDNPAAVRERILETASALFYRRGVRAVGVDLVVVPA